MHLVSLENPIHSFSLRYLCIFLSAHIIDMYFWLDKLSMLSKRKWSMIYELGASGPSYTRYVGGWCWWRVDHTLPPTLPIPYQDTSSTVVTVPSLGIFTMHDELSL